MSVNWRNLNPLLAEFVDTIADGGAFEFDRFQTFLDDTLRDALIEANIKGLKFSPHPTGREA